MQKLILIITTYCLLSLPAFAVTDLNNNVTVNFNDYLTTGKWTVLEIWAHDCPACRKTMHHLSDFNAIAENYNAQVIGVSLDGYDRRQQAQSFVKNQDMEFTNLLANVPEVEQFIHKYAPQAPLGTPTVMLFSPEAEFAGIIVGPVSMDELVHYFEEQQKVEQSSNTTTDIL
jgi:peroxiredoxin